MKTSFNPEIKTLLERELLPGICFWQVRGIVLEVEEVAHPTANPDKQNPGGRLRDLVLKIGDLDNHADGYDVRLEGNYHQVELLDVVSLLGHEDKDAEAVSSPRLFINHNTGQFARAYPIEQHLTYGCVPMIEHKFWLSYKVPMRWRYRAPLFLINHWKVLLFLLVSYTLVRVVDAHQAASYERVSPYGQPMHYGQAFSYGQMITYVIALFVLCIGLALPSFFGLIIGLKLVEWMEAQKPFSFEERKTPSLFIKNLQEYNTHLFYNLTRAYEKAAALFHQDALQNPAPEIGFIPVERGLHTVGILPAPDTEEVREKARQVAL